jgi:HD-like signal output (HDOD) protein
VLKKTVFRSQVGSNPVAIYQPSLVTAAQAWPPVPVFPETVLLLELEAQEPCADLRRLSQVVLSDLGATLQILRLAGREYGNTEDRPNRIEDCISDLGLRSCLNAVATQITARSDRPGEIAAIWAHSREIAHHSRLIAEDLPEVNPQDAYLVGLLHAIGLLPDLLGWNGRETDAFESAHIAFMMATQWSLPHVVVDAFRAMCHANEESEWTAILMSAHQRAIATSIDCPYRQEVRPLLYKPIPSDFAVYAGSVSV